MSLRFTCHKTCLAVLLIPGLVHAETATEEVQPVLEEVLVTAQRRGPERLQGVPMSISVVDRKTIERNGKKYPKILDHVGHYFAVVIAPGDISMIYGDNKDRRRFIDQIISQTDQHYLHALVAYNKLIEQRNRHLKSDWVDQVLLDALDEHNKKFKKKTTE